MLLPDITRENLDRLDNDGDGRYCERYVAVADR